MIDCGMLVLEGKGFDRTPYMYQNSSIPHCGIAGGDQKVRGAAAKAYPDVSKLVKLDFRAPAVCGRPANPRHFHARGRDMSNPGIRTRVWYCCSLID